MTKKLKLSVQRRLSKYGGIKMNLAFALKSYNETKVSKDMANGDGYEAVKFALKQAIASMEKLNLIYPMKQREHHFERALRYLFVV